MNINSDFISSLLILAFLCSFCRYNYVSCDSLLDGVNVKLLGSRADDGSPVLLEVTDDCSSGVAILSQVRILL